MLEGETVGSGASRACDDCGVEVRLEVLRSAAGFYIGTQCNCGPYSRESGYFSTREDADTAFFQGTWRPRTGEYTGGKENESA